MVAIELKKGKITISNHSRLWYSTFNKNSTKKRNYYELLNVKPSCTNKDIKAAYYKLSLIHHPDQSTDQKKSHDEFVLITEAYRVLRNEQTRRKYDLENRIRGGVKRVNVNRDHFSRQAESFYGAGDKYNIFNRRGRDSFNEPGSRTYQDAKMDEQNHHFASQMRRTMFYRANGYHFDDLNQRNKASASTNKSRNSGGHGGNGSGSGSGSGGSEFFENGHENVLNLGRSRGSNNAKRKAEYFSTFIISFTLVGVLGSLGIGVYNVL